MGELDSIWLNVPRRYRGCSLGNFIGQRVKNDLLKYLKTPQASTEIILINGPVGTGKTHLAVAILRKALENLHPNLLRFESVSALLEKIKGSYDNKGETAFNILDGIIQKELLVLDDLGAEHHTEWSSNIIYQIIDGRYSTMRPTIVTTNLSADMLTKIFDARLVSRLRSGYIITLRGKDKRQKSNG